MAMRLAVIVLPLLLYPHYADAAFALGNCAGLKVANFSQVFLETGVPCDSAMRVQNELESIKSFAGSEPPLVLFINFKAYEGYSDYGRLIVLNFQQMAWEQVRPQMQNDKIWAHEIGHTFFATWLATDFEPIRGFRDYLVENTKLISQAANPKLDTTQQMNSKWQKVFGKARDIQVPYTELFADLTGVLFADDPMAMTTAMASPNMPANSKAETAYYGFSGEYDVAKWNASEVHYYFAPVRAFIGKRFLHFPMTSSQKASVLRTVYHACLHDIKKYWNSNQSLPGVAEANLSLIDTLSKL